MLTLAQSELPPALLPLSHPVRQLHVSGASLDELLARPRIAIVGSRKITPYGRGVTEDISSYLAQAGVVVVSGLALGADSVAHQACLAAGGQTIAVLPCGPERVYPSTHTNLARQIIEQGGTLVTEYDEGTEPYKLNFLERNRIIAALSDAVIVTEAAMRSGSLNTANHALELGKPVFAVPGNITSTLSAGCNNLIKAGAIPVTTPQDILDAMGWHIPGKTKKKVTGNTDEERIILNLLEEGVSDGGELLVKSNLDAGVFNQHLTMLEITGRIRPTGANNWSL